MSAIFKLQKSLSTTAATQQVLIYNESQTIRVGQSLTPDVAKWFGTKDKVYVKANFRHGQLAILNAAKAQTW